MCGFDEAQMNYTLLETIVHHTPAGSSTRFINTFTTIFHSLGICYIVSNFLYGNSSNYDEWMDSKGGKSERYMQQSFQYVHVKIQ